MSSTTADALSGDNEGDDELEYEYVEYDTLQEADFQGSEWLVGTVMDDDPSKIVETWVRLVVDEDGNNVAVWGDDKQGKWSLDVASQFFSVSKENRLAGKQIWAGVVDDYYYLQGTVRGWTYWAAASVLGQWQAKRLGVDETEEDIGIAPWFQQTTEDDEADTNSDDQEQTPALEETAQQ